MHSSYCRQVDLRKLMDDVLKFFGSGLPRKLTKTGFSLK